MGAMLPGHLVHRFVSPSAQGWLELLLATPVVLWGGWPFFERMGTSFRTGRLNMFTLIGIGTGIAWLYSLAAVLAARRLSRRPSAATTARSGATSSRRR